MRRRASVVSLLIVVVSGAPFLPNAAAYKQETHTDLARRTVDLSALHRVDSGIWRTLWIA
jgi:hypothetical protein